MKVICYNGFMCNDQTKFGHHWAENESGRGKMKRYFKGWLVILFLFLPLVTDGDYRLDLENLNDMWTQMKESIMEFRQGSLDGNELLQLSEDYFTQANETVFSADRYSSAQIRMLSSICIGMFATMLLVWGLLFLALSEKLLSWNPRTNS